MSLYNMLHGKNPAAKLILATLDLTTGDVGRFRDTFVSNGEIAVYTRNGGGNREEYQCVFDSLSVHPNYLRDSDDDFDCTYATIYFSLPERYREFLQSLESGDFNPSKKWIDYLENMKSPDYKMPEPLQNLVKVMSETLQSGDSAVIKV